MKRLTKTGKHGPTGKPEGRYLSYQEVAKKLGGITLPTLRLRINQAGIKPVRPGRTPFLHEDDIPRLIEATRERAISRALEKLEAKTTARRPRSLNTAANRRHGRTPALSGT